MPLPPRSLPANALIHPIWGLRFFPLVATVLVAAALLFAHNEILRSIFLGGALGILLGNSFFAFQVHDVTMKSDDQPADVQRYPWA